MHYTASSVKKALDANKNLSTSQFAVIGCQSQKPAKQANFLLCQDSQKKCKRGAKRLRSRFLHVDNVCGKSQLVVVLRFNFTISGENADGFIRKDDFALAKLLREKHIDAKFLKDAKLAGV